jgi:SAM-dependent methyltransferase
MRFVKGMIEFIEDAGVANESIDLAISNCVINLSPDKRAVLDGVFKALREGGEFYFSDVYCDRRLPQAVREHDVMLGECLGGALYTEDFHRICRDVGFNDVRELTREPIDVTDPELKELCGNATFYSITYRCFKIASLETLCEDYGQVAYYRGTIADQPQSYALDDHHVFETDRPMLVCGNTASMVEDSWLTKHFEVIGDRNTHYGLFDCAPSGGGAVNPTADAPADGGSCC